MVSTSVAFKCRYDCAKSVTFGNRQVTWLLGTYSDSVHSINSINNASQPLIC